MRRGCEDRGSAGVVSPLGRMRHVVQEVAVRETLHRVKCSLRSWGGGKVGVGVDEFVAGFELGVADNRFGKPGLILF